MDKIDVLSKKNSLIDKPGDQQRYLEDTEKKVSLNRHFKRKKRHSRHRKKPRISKKT